MRRIKDIEAIESDSFVPQAFKSSRDDIKVRSVSLFPLPLSLSVFSLCLLLNFPLYSAGPSVQRQPRPNQTFPFSAVCSNLRRFHQALHCSPPPKRLHPHKSHSRQQPSSVSLSVFLSLSSPLWLCRCRKNTEVIIEMFLSLKEQELDLLGLKAVLKR